MLWYVLNNSLYLSRGTNINNHAGHENMGIVIEAGTGVSLLKKGDRVVMPFNVADGRCRNCEEGRTAFCTGVNPGFAGGAYGYVGKSDLIFLIDHTDHMYMFIETWGYPSNFS